MDKLNNNNVNLDILKRFASWIMIPATLMMLMMPVHADEITLNLKDADIRALISTVSKFTGRNFIIDPRVKAKVTVVSSKTMSADEVYEVFLSLLQVHGYAAVTVGSVIKIVPEVNAKQGPLPIHTKDAGGGDALITRVVRLDHVPAAQLVPILRPLVPQQGHLAAYNPTNTLIISDHAGNIQRLMKIIRGVDRPDNDELEVIQLQHASASELVRILNTLHPKATGKNQAKSITLAADDRTNSILMSGNRSTRLKLRTTILHLDTPLEDGGNTHVIYLKYAKAEDMVTILTGVQSSKAKTQGAARGKAAAVAGGARKTNFSIQGDDATNAVIITADPNTLRSVKAVIRQLDIRRAQVLIEAIIAEVTTNINKDLGVGAIAAPPDSGSTGSTVPVGISNLGGIGALLGAIGTDDRTTLAAIGQNLGSGLTLGLGKVSSGGSGNRFALILRALAQDSATNIMSTPSIVTLDNEEAEILVGQNVPFITGQFTNAGTTTGANPFQTIERQDVGLKLKVTPQINEGDTIKLDIEQEVSDVTSISETAGPTTRKRTVKTSVLVDDGGILVLGGLIQETVNDVESKVPLLGDIPLLGHLFKSRSTSREKQNLMVFMRPTIIRDDNTAALYTHEKYSYMRTRQLRAMEENFGLLDDDNRPLLPEKMTKPVMHKDAGEALKQIRSVFEEQASAGNESGSTTEQAQVEDPWGDDENDDFF